MALGYHANGAEVGLMERVKLGSLRQSFGDLPASAYLVFVALFIAHASWVALLDHYTVPYIDDWRVLDGLFSTPLAQWLFEEQNGHRVPVTLFLFFLDYSLFGGKEHLLVVASVVCAWLAIGALYVGFRAGGDAPSATSKAVFGFMGFCMAWAWSFYDLIWGAQQATLLASMWIVVSIVCLVLYHAGCSRGDPRNRAHLPWLAGLGAVLATFSFGWGFGVWVALILLSLVGRFRKRILASFAAGAVLSLGIYSVGLETPVATVHKPVGFAAVAKVVRDDPEGLFSFAATLIGAPAGYVARGLGWVDGEDPKPRRELSFSAGVMGFAGLALFALSSLLRLLRVSSRDLLSLGLMTASASGGLIVAVNRLWSPASAVHERFLTLSILFWVGAACGVLSLLGRRDWRPSRRIVGVALLWLLSISMIPGLQEMRSHHDGVRWRLSEISAMHLAGVQWDARMMMQSPELVYRVVARLRRDRRGFFADVPADVLGARLSERFQVDPAGRCAGTIEKARAIEARAGLAAEVFGRAWDASEDEAPAFVVLAGPNGIIRGLGTFARAGAGGAGSPECADPEACSGRAWIAFIDGLQRSERYTAHAVVSGGASVCRLAALRTTAHGRLPRVLVENLP